MDYDKKYIEETFFFEQDKTALNLVFMFSFEHNLFPKDPLDVTFIPKEFLKTKFDYYVLKRGLSTDYDPQKIFSQFGRLGINKTRLKDKSRTYYRVSASNLL